jgi:hypothetical protein
MKISPNSWEQKQKTREQKSNLACNENNKHRATKKKHNGGEVRDEANGGTATTTTAPYKTTRIVN